MYIYQKNQRKRSRGRVWKEEREKRNDIIIIFKNVLKDEWHFD